MAKSKYTPNGAGLVAIDMDQGWLGYGEYTANRDNEFLERPYGQDDSRM